MDHASIGECDRFAETIIHFLLELDVSCQNFTSKSNAFLALDIIQSGLGLLNKIFLIAARSTKKSISPLMALLFSRTYMLSAEIGELSDRAILFFELNDPKGNIFDNCPSKPGGITPVKRSYPSSTPKSMDFIRPVRSCPKAETEPVNLNSAAESVIAPSVSLECFHIGSYNRGNAKSDGKIQIPVKQSRNPEFSPHQNITVQVPEKEVAISTNLVKLEDCESITAASFSTPCEDREQLPEIFYDFDELE